MKSRYAFENLLRDPWELLIAMVAFGFGLLCLIHPSLFALSFSTGLIVAGLFFILALSRSFQGFQIYWYRKRLLQLKPFSLSTRAIPISQKQLYLGKGFRWLPRHRQRLDLLTLVENERYLKKGKCHQWMQKTASKKPQGICNWVTQLPFSSVRAQPPVGGKPWLHGVGSDAEEDLYLPQANRNTHTVVFGMTRVGKTRLMSILLNQDIRDGEAVLVLDPKGDLELLRDMVSACKAANRLNDLIVLHAGFPELSARYNPLSSYSNVSEVATRVTSAIQAEGEGKQFQDFAWKFLNIVAQCLEEMGEPISYKTLAFFVTRPRQLLLAYCDKVLPEKDPEYLYKVEEILNNENAQIDSQGKASEKLSRSDAARLYVARYIESVISSGDYNTLHDSIIAELHHAAEIGEEYYGKITASLGPVFDKINKTAAGEIFSWDVATHLPIIQLEQAIKRKQIIYIGLDAQTNEAMANAVGQAVIADLVSLCGRLYKEVPGKSKGLCLHADEFSNIVRDEFVSLLNKAGGAGIKVTAYTQTVNDIGAVFGSGDKPKMLLGNFGTMIMMRVANRDTAEVFTRCLETTKTRSTTPSTMANDRSGGEEGELFTTYNTDTITEEKNQIITENDLFSLPKGQAFVLTNGGELYKVRIPLPENTDDSPPTFETLLYEVNLCPR